MKTQIRIGLMAVLMISSTLLQNCGDDPSPKAEEVYLTGFVDEGKANYSVAYTKNGVAEIIGGGDVYESPNDITLDGNDVYVGGYVSGNANMIYWKNGEKVFVPKDPNMAWEEIRKITVKNGKKYFLVYGPGGINAYRYYVDGVKTILPTQGIANDMAVASNGDVYVIGKSNSDKAVYWKNGVMKELNSGDSGATAITIVGSDVYIAGWYMNDESYPVAVVWKNEVMEEFGDPGVYAYDITVSGNDVYLAGNKTADDTVVIWKNGVEVTLEADGYSITDINDLKSKNGNWYLLTRDNLTGRPLLFKNGEVVAPFNGTQEGEFYAMALK